MTAKRLASAANTSNEPSYLLDRSVALGLLANDRFPEAIAEAKLAIAELQHDVGRDAEFPWLVLIAAESGSGQDTEARGDLQKFLATPRTYRSITETQKNPQFAATAQLLDGLRRAGMPAE